MKVPDWYRHVEHLKLLPLRQQFVIVVLVAVYHVGSEAPVESWVLPPLVYKCGICLQVDLPFASFPMRISSIVDNEALADFGNKTELIWTCERNASMASY
jgi:hypothetical protein